MKKISRKQVDSFWKNREKISDQRVSTHFKKDDTHVYDLELIEKYCNKTSKVLDVACGTCYLSNKLVNKVAYIKATDKFSGFLSHCKVSEKLETEVVDILEFSDTKKYDVILMFGIIMYFDEEDTQKIYEKYSKMLSDDGVLIVKHQCGVDEDVVINDYSSQVGSTYHAFYKSVKKDQELLGKVFSKVKTVDIYPERLNPWPNTHFYAFIASR